jgi:hypothetical protein
MTWFIYGIIGFTILSGAAALVYARSDSDDGRNEESGAPEGQFQFGQRSSPSR